MKDIIIQMIQNEYFFTVYTLGFILCIFPLAIKMINIKIHYCEFSHKLISTQIEEIEQNKQILKGEDLIWAYINEKVPNWLVFRIIELSCFINLIVWPMFIVVTILRKIFKS